MTESHDGEPRTSEAAGSLDLEALPGVSAAAEPLAVVTRSGFVESRHSGHAVVVDAGGAVLARVGDPDATCFPRSSLKPAQAAAALLVGADLHDAALALAAASHVGRDVHVDLVGRMLADAGLTPGHLQTPPAMPVDADARGARTGAGLGPDPACHECSGKHAGMLVASRAAGWTLDDYRDPAHPLQRLTRVVVARASAEPTGHVGIDGCGAPLVATSVTGLARTGARLGRAMARAAGQVHPVGDGVDPDDESIDAALGQVGRAMAAHPWAVRGAGHADTRAMQELPGVVAKHGAEGVQLLATSDGLGVAVKVLDGTGRAAMVTALALLAEHRPDVQRVLPAFTPTVLGHGRPVGHVHPLVGWRSSGPSG